MSWLKSGFNNVAEEGERRDSEFKIPELWLTLGKEKKIMFLDHSPACVHTHMAKIHGEWKTFTCLADTGSEDVPCCEILGSKKRQFVGYFTVVDLSTYTDKKGDERKNEIKLFPAKFKTLKLIQEVLAEQGSLMGKVIKLKRLEEKSPASGDYVAYVGDQAIPDDINYRQKLVKDLAKEPDKWEKQIVLPKTGKGYPLVNYMEVLAPRSPKEIRAMLRGYKPTDFNGKTTETKQQDDDIPF